MLCSNATPGTSTADMWRSRSLMSESLKAKYLDPRLRGNDEPPTLAQRDRCDRINFTQESKTSADTHLAHSSYSLNEFSSLAVNFHEKEKIDMAKRALALHLVEKGVHSENLYRVPGSPEEWRTGYWRIADKTAKQLEGRRIYLHKGQKEASHAGGEIISSCPGPSLDSERKIFHFRALPDCIDYPSPSGWGNEKCIVWSED